MALAAVPLVLALAARNPPVPEAVYHRAALAASGAYPTLVPQNPRAAFRDFEAAARAGHAPAWFRLARDYEAFTDFPHAQDCLQRGARAHDPAALHRLGVAHLLGQLGLTTNPAAALPFLSQAAARASLQCPQPAYVFALVLLNEFSVPVERALLPPFLPPGTSAAQYAKSLLERAAALHFAPAQYKLGHAYEFAVPPQAFPFEPLLSVQWYSLASQAGEAEADMALSKWFLCGAEGAFDKDESLARTFAAKAATKGLASGEFAMGYYAEVGIGGARDVTEARSWYSKAAANGNTDATDRLRALAEPAAQALSRTEHDALTGDKLVRKRTQARARSDREGAGAPYSEEPASFLNPHPDVAPPANPYTGRPHTGGPPSSYQAPPQQRPPLQGQPADPTQRRTRVMELARKSSLADAGYAPGHGRAGSTGMGGGYDFRGSPAPQQGPGRPGPGPGSQTPSGAGSPAFPTAYGAGGSGRMPPVAERREGSVGPGVGARPPRDGSVPPGGGRGRGFALSDGGALSPSPGQQSRPVSVASSGRAQGMPPGRRQGAGTPGAGGAPGGGAGREDPTLLTTTTGGGGPATFAEMGFTGAKADDKECVIM